MSDTLQSTLTLVKGGHRWVFIYQRGQEAATLMALADVARDPDDEFDWFDASVLASQMSRDQVKRLNQMMLFDQEDPDRE